MIIQNTSATAHDWHLCVACCCPCRVTVVDAADTRQVLQVLSYTVKMLQRVPLRQQGLDAAGTGSISFASLWELLLLLALKSEHAVVRCGVLGCWGVGLLVLECRRTDMLALQCRLALTTLNKKAFATSF